MKILFYEYHEISLNAIDRYVFIFYMLTRRERKKIQMSINLANLSERERETEIESESAHGNITFIMGRNDT